MVYSSTRSRCSVTFTPFIICAVTVIVCIHIYAYIDQRTLYDHIKRKESRLQVRYSTPIEVALCKPSPSLYVLL